MRLFHLVLRYGWALPGTAIGLLLLLPAVCAGATARAVDGVIEVAGEPIGRAISLLPRALRFGAITFGHVIIGLDHRLLSVVRAHEHVHVGQYEKWGPLFIPLYLASSLIQMIGGRDPYWNNRFEREAHAIAPATAIVNAVVHKHRAAQDR